MSGYDIDLAITIRRPPRAVFDLLADIQDVEPIPRGADIEMRKDPPGPTRVGTRWHERVRLAPGCWLSVESVVTELREPAVLGMEFRSRPWRGHLTYEIEAVPGGRSVLHHRETLKLRRPLRLLTALIGRQLEAHVAQRLRDIRDVLEVGSAAPLRH